MKTSILIGIIAIVLIVVAAGAALYVYTSHPSTSTSSSTSMIVPSTTSTTSTTSTITSTSSTSTSTSTSSNTTQVFPSTANSYYGLFSPSNATSVTGMNKFYVLSYLEIENLNTLKVGSTVGGSSISSAMFPSGIPTSNFAYIINMSAPVYVEVLAHNSTTYMLLSAFNYNTTKGESSAMLISGILGSILKNASSGYYKGLQYVYGYYNASSNHNFMGNISMMKSKAVLGIAFGYLSNGRAFFVVATGTQNVSNTAFSTLKMLALIDSGKIPSPPKQLVSTAFPTIEYGYLNATLLRNIAMSINYTANTTYNVHNVSFNMNVTFPKYLKYVNFTSASELVSAQVMTTSSHHPSVQFISLAVANTTNGTAITNLIDLLSTHVNGTIYFNGTSNGARLLIVYLPHSNLTYAVASYDNFAITAAYYSKVDEGAYLMDLIQSEVSLLS